MKKSILFILVVFLVFCSSCRREPQPNDEVENGGLYSNNEIVAQNIENDNDKIDKVIAIILDYYNDCNDDYDWYIVASCKYENHGFNMKLPSRLHAKYLEEYFNEQMMSDPRAKCAMIEYFIALDIDGEDIGEFEFKGDSIDEESMYIYADRNFTLRGHDSYSGSSYEDHYIYDCHFKKGWNLVYQYLTRSRRDSIFIYTQTTTTQKPLDINYKWHFYSYDNEKRKLNN